MTGQKMAAKETKLSIEWYKIKIKQGQGLMAKAAHLYPKFPSVLSPTPFPSPPPPPID